MSRRASRRPRHQGLLLAALLAALLPGAGRAEELVLALSTREVAITSTYTGAEITVFGLIERDARTIARSGNYDVVANVQGPQGDVVVHRKGRFGPIWLTDQRRRYMRIPLFFSLLTARPLHEITDEAVRERLRLGLEYFLPDAASVPDAQGSGEFGFRNALLRLRREEGAVTQNERAVTMIRPNLFTATIRLPAKAPTGLYLVNISVLSEGVPLKTAQAGFVVRKVGFDAFVANAARNEAWAYALFSVAMAILLGWIANIAFRRD
jgi:uncharacterized protein (TIGR02186 family)